MYIKNLTLVNIRSCPKVSLEFSKGINLLIGHNNSGKSTIIKSLYRLQNDNTISIMDLRKQEEQGIIHITLNEIEEEGEQKLFKIQTPDTSFTKLNENNAEIVFHIHKQNLSDLTIHSYYIKPELEDASRQFFTLPDKEI